MHIKPSAIYFLMSHTFKKDLQEHINEYLREGGKDGGHDTQDIRLTCNIVIILKSIMGYLIIMEFYYLCN